MLLTMDCLFQFELIKSNASLIINFSQPRKYKVSDKYSKRKLAGSSITTVVSLSLVLFMLGLLGIIILNTRKLSDNFKENIGIQLVLSDNANELDVQHLIETLDASDYVKSTQLVSKEEAAKKLQQDLGEDFIDFLGFNPLSASISVRLKAGYANSDSLNWIEKELMDTKMVKEVIYQKSLVNTINENVKTISIGVLMISSLLMVIALALINNTIRLSIYSKRFIIKTMQLVGASQGFIRRPFVLKGIKHGIYGATIAILLLIGFLYFIQKQLPELAELQDINMLASLFGLVILLGIIISWISTSLAVRKYLRLKSDEMHY
jgi:cell division transport system permease protein